VIEKESAWWVKAALDRTDSNIEVWYPTLTGTEDAQSRMTSSVLSVLQICARNNCGWEELCD
jgi:hypothetical protein